MLAFLFTLTGLARASDNNLALIRRSDQAEPALPEPVLPEPVLPPDPPSVFDKLMTPFVNEAQSRRGQWKSKSKDPWFDSDYKARIDWELNAERVNYLLYGEGITNEPKDKAGTDNIGRIGSHCH